MFFKQVFKKSTAEKKPYNLIATFYNSLLECGAIALINKPTRVAKKSATIIEA